MQNQFWRLPRVLEETGLSRPVLYRKMAAGEFPKSFHIGERAVAWSSDDIEAWKATTRRNSPRKAA